MKTTAKKIARDESGKILILVLVLLVVGGLLLGPLLGLMSTGLASGQVYEKKASELYAADAGVEDAIWRIYHGVIPPGSWQESTDQPGWWIHEYPEPLVVNEKSIDVVVYRKDLDPTCREELVYRIFATAVTENGSGVASIPGSTTVEAYVKAAYMDFSGLLDYAIASNGPIRIGGQGQGGGGGAAPQIYGDVYIHDKLLFGGDDWIKDDYDIYDATDRTVVFPGFGDLEPYYSGQVNDSSPDVRSTINISGHGDDNPYVLSGLYVPDGNQGKLTIQEAGSVQIRGVVYVKGDLHFDTHQRLILGEDAVIFVAGNEDNERATGEITGSPGFVVLGSGCIIAKGDVTLNPMFLSSSGDPESTDFVLIYSLEGVTTLLPSGNFHGTVVGESAVTPQPNSVFRWTSAEGKGLNFPMGVLDIDNLPPAIGVMISSWEIK